MPASEALKRAVRKYEKENIRQIKFNLSLKYDRDVIEKLDSVQNKQGYIKSLIRADIARANSGKKEEEQTMKKIYDLRINSHGKAQPMSDGFFASTAALVNGYNEADYTTREFSDCVYRISKRDLDRPCIQDFLARKEKSQTRANSEKEEEESMSIYDFVQNLFNSCPVTPERMDLDTARVDLANFASEGWEMPSDITPEEYMTVWNELVSRQENDEK